MKKPLIASLLMFFVINLSVKAQNISEINIPYTKYVLDNGLTLIVHEDHKAPIVAVNVWYHVGSKNEKVGKTGFAHLFEHLMFNGSENFDDDYFQVMERVGATDLNGTTNNDRTNYFQNVPTSAVDLALWMESDRMGHLLGAVTQEKLDEQRGVVQNEKRQGENQPYAVANELITKGTYPAGHPYSWTVIGSMEDLDAASLDDVHEWFKTYYGAANAVLVVAGDITPEIAKEKVEKYFGDIPSGPPIAKFDTYISKMDQPKRQIAQDRVPQARIYKVWNVPEWGNEELAYLDLASDVLSAGKSSRLYKRLVYDEQIATDVAAYYSGGEIGSQFTIRATAKPGGNLNEVEKAIDEELQRFLNEGPTQTELDRVKTRHIAGFVRGIERIGGFGGKSDILAQSLVYGGDPERYKKYLGYVAYSTVDDIKSASNKWLDDGVYTLEINPFPKYTELPVGADRSKLPETGTPPDVSFPEVSKATLSNGLKVMLAQRSSVPLVNFNLLFDAGYASDQFGIPGTAGLAMSMLDEGTDKMNSLEISETLDELGATLGSGSNLDMSTVAMSALKDKIDQSLDLYTDVILNPSFPEAELERLRKERLAQIQREKSSPIQMGLRTFPGIIYGKDHAYGLPFSGTGYEETVVKISRDDLVKFHDTWFKPNNATLVVTGDISMDELLPKLESHFGEWEEGEVPVKNISEVNNTDKPVIYLMDKPGAPQSVIFAAELFPGRGVKNNLEIETMNDILGGTFTSRINMNLREDKHWSYGSQSVLIGARGQRPFVVFAMVQSDKTKESLAEVQREVAEYVSTNPATDDELNKIKLNNTLALPGNWETNGAVGGSIAQMVRYDLPDDYFDTYSSRVKNLSLDAVRNAAKETLDPNDLVWVVVGDKAQYQDKLKEFGYEIHEIDVDGNIIDEEIKAPETSETPKG
ncbi:MAG: insulinase family protein [Melioribacteraceae bacterium]|nr:insulinase family protein [Candidatus Cloacimonadota bacterium]MCF8242489.1 insulinase family protein [Melioribacteraceae bacterium]MCF8356340.1 insulinase family protein [Melioribacteraceae bacterium]MCF8395749.1 insulinase family protein [Melioribacteraceae bacterium]MCF8420551.1 insulinase family protein [Melioribacteraceae bacterium]